MFCGKCGIQIPPGASKCPECGWQLTMAARFHKHAMEVAMQEAGAGKAGSRAGGGRKEGRKRQGRTGRPGPAPVWGCLAAAVLVAALFVAGVLLLFNHRGAAGEKLSREQSGQEVPGSPPRPLEGLRAELLTISGRISGMDSGMPTNPLVLAKRLDEIGALIGRYPDDPLYFKVYALHKSVIFQLNMSEKGGLDPKMPPLPYSPIVLKPSEQYVLGNVSADSLVTGRIVTAGKEDPVRYGPALLCFEEPMKKYLVLSSLEAPPGYRFAEVVVEVQGNVDLVEYEARLLDDYRRAFPPLLDAEKEARKKALPKGHFLWRDLPGMSESAAAFLHRIFLVPEDATANPILEIKRQSASRMLWVQY